MLDSRQEQVLSLLKRFDYLTIKQFRQLIDLGGERNAYRVIKQLEPYLSVFKDEGTNVYYLNKNGREYVNSKRKRTKLTTAQHYLIRNNLFIRLGKPYTWQNEVLLGYETENKKHDINVVADAHFTKHSIPFPKDHIVEIDNTQKMKKNAIKIDKYRRLTERGVFKVRPKLIWVTTSPYRQKALKELCDGMEAEVYLYSDLY